MSNFEKKVSYLVERIEDNNRWRQHNCINLIPSETTPSLLVKICEIADPSGRYAEHRTMKGKEVYFYQGIDFIKDVEEEAREAICEFFNCTQAELRPVSGQMANEVVFKAVTKFVNHRDKSEFARMSCVMNNDLGKGGHLSSQPMGALYNYVAPNSDTGKENCINFPVLKDNPYRIDVPKMLDMLETYKPDLAVFGKSMFIYPEPVKEFYDAVNTWAKRPVIMFDMAHVLGLYGAFQSPLDEGADIITGSTHKTYFGPQRGVVVSNLDKKSDFRKVWLEVKSRAFPGSTSNHHLGTLVALLMATHEMNAFKNDFQNQVLKNAKALAKYLVAAGIPVEGNPNDGYTQTHQVIIRISQFGDGQDIARRLENNNIVCNYQALPDDETFLSSSGLRMGVQEMTRYGMKEADFETVAGFIADVVKNNVNVKEDVSLYRKNFLTQTFCLPPEKAVNLAARVLGTVLPNSDYVKMFVDRLIEIAPSIG
jgi:glycine/serine hydroxymethyltransferase